MVAQSVRRWLVAIPALLVLGVAALSARQVVPPNLPPLTPTSLVGADSYGLYCASCHGFDGKGNGPQAAALKIKPSDLTTIARRNAGVFPFDGVRDYITGLRRPDVHGTSSMPVWGAALRALDPSDASVRVRIDNLTSYVQSLQLAPLGGPLSRPHRVDGVALYRGYCGACHGTNARGDGPTAAQMRTAPPDLTLLATRNGGAFPAERVRQIILGSGPAAHGPRDMPLWRALVTGHDEDDSAASVQAIIEFLSSVQQRAG